MYQQPPAIAQFPHAKTALAKEALATPPRGPLNGIFVVEIGQHVSGPMLGEHLARNGALVIKIEKANVGDPARNYMSPEIFNSINAAKLSVAIDKNNADLYSKILEIADVIIDNRSPEGKLMDVVLNTFLQNGDKQHPVIFCSIIGYEGEESKHLLALDVAVQAGTGMAYVNGIEPDQPLKVGFVVLDEATSMQAYGCIVSHLFALTQGDYPAKSDKEVIRLEISMAGVSAHLLTGQILSCVTTQKEPTRTGNRDNWLTPFSFYKTKDGIIAIAIIDETQYGRFCTHVLENKDLLVRFPTNKIRMENIQEFEQLLNNILQTQDSVFWFDKCQQHKVPASYVNSVTQALQQSFFKHIITTTKSGIKIIADPFSSSLFGKTTLRDAPALNSGFAAVHALLEKYNEVKNRFRLNKFADFYKREQLSISEPEPDAAGVGARY